jgi:hypothetical protein
MDTKPLVENERRIAARIMSALAAAKVVVDLCDWHYVPPLEEWQLIIATPLYDSIGPRGTYFRLVDALERAGIYKDVPMRRVFLKSPKDPVVKLLRQEAREQQEGTIFLLKEPRNGPEQYSAVFSPFLAIRDSVVVRRFSALEEVEMFLKNELREPESEWRRALNELKATRSASIFPVQRSVRELKRLGLA